MQESEVWMCLQLHKHLYCMQESYQRMISQRHRSIRAAREFYQRMKHPCGGSFALLSLNYSYSQRCWVRCVCLAVLAVWRPTAPEAAEEGLRRENAGAAVILQGQRGDEGQLIARVRVP